MRACHCGILRFKQATKSLAVSCLVLLTVGLSDTGVHAQPNESWDDADTVGLQVEAVVGWGGLATQQGPIPVSFLITNNTGRTIEGHLTIHDPATGREEDLGEIYLAPQATRRLSTIQTFADWFNCFAVLHDERHVFWRRELQLTTGKPMSPGGRYVLVIDKDGRNLLAKSTDGGPQEANEQYYRNQRTHLIGLPVPSWQLPHHPGPLAMAVGIVFPENAADDLNRLQWRAIAEWVCRGGTVFFHDQSSELIRQLTDALPLPSEAASPADGLTIRLSGLGAICEYSQPLGNADGEIVRQQIADRVGTILYSNVWQVADSAWFERAPGSRADLSRLLIILVFVSYALMSGAGALLMFRASRRRVGFYTLIIVLSSSVMAGMVGGYLRLSDGDLSWITITQPGVGGAVQYARIDVQSAGGRNTQVAVGTNSLSRSDSGTPDLQCSPLSRWDSWRYRDNGRNMARNPPFQWQPNLLRGQQSESPQNACQIQVPITPWGERRCYATAFQPTVPELGFELTLSPPPAQFRSANELPKGIFTLKLANHLDQDLMQAWLVIGTTVQNGSPDVLNMTNRIAYDRSGRRMMGQQPDPEGNVAMYQIRPLQPVSAGKRAVVEFDAEFAMIEEWQRVCNTDSGAFTPPGREYAGASNAWLIARVKNSPILKIEESLSDFVPREEIHLIIQQLRPEHLTDEAGQLRLLTR